MQHDSIWYTYKGAARRLKLSEGTIKRWVREGMETALDGQDRRIIHHDVLLAEYRKRLKNNPVHQQRMRAR